jgi:hypothetical protein
MLMSQSGRRLMELMAGAGKGVLPWPPTSAVLVSIRDQHGSETLEWQASFPDSVASEVLFSTVLIALTLWRSALDRGEPGDPQRELYETVIAALGRACP